MINLINKVLGAFHVELRRAYSNQFEVKRKLLRGKQRPLILDIGAHHGGSVKNYRHHFPDAIIHAFEPSPDIHSILKNTFCGDPDVILHQMALSDKVGKLDFHVNKDSFTNSLLEIDNFCGRIMGSRN